MTFSGGWSDIESHSLACKQKQEYYWQSSSASTNARNAWLIDYESFLAVTFPVTEFFSIIIIQNQIWTSSALELKTVSQSSNLMKIQRIEIHRHGIHLITADIWYISSALNKVWRWLNCTDSYSTCEIQRIHCISIPNSKKLRHEC